MRRLLKQHAVKASVPDGSGRREAERPRRDGSPSPTHQTALQACVSFADPPHDRQSDRDGKVVLTWLH